MSICCSMYDCTGDLLRASLVWALSTRIKDAGIAIRHSRGRILFYTAGSRNGLEGVDNRGTVTRKGSCLRKRHFFVMEKYIEDAKQEEKDVPDLLESIMRSTCLVKEE